MTDVPVVSVRHVRWEILLGYRVTPFSHGSSKKIVFCPSRGPENGWCTASPARVKSAGRGLPRLNFSAPPPD